MGAGTQKIEMNKRTKSAMPSKEYEAMKASMLKQAEMAGMQQVTDDLIYEGAGSAFRRNPKYGNVNATTQGMMQGEESAADLNDSFNNAPLAKPTAQTGLMGYFSSTQSPQAQPEFMGQEAQDGIRQRVLGENRSGLNDIAQIYRPGGG